MQGEWYRKLIEESTDIATIIDVDGIITYVSPAVRNTLGYEPAELVGEVGYEYQHPDDRDAVVDGIDALQSGSKDRQVIETRFRRADGSWCWIEATLQDRLADPDIEGILVNSRDISERKHQESRYHELAREYNTLLQTVDDAIFFVSVDAAGGGYEFRFEHLSKSYETQTGITTEAARGRTPTEVFGPELGDELRANYRRCVETRESITYQEEVPVDTGARFWQTNLAPVITDSQVTQIIGITRNVTDRVKRERQLRRQKDRLDEFASVVSHDLRNPLTVAMGRTEYLAEQMENEHLDAIERALARIEEIISDTLTLARQGQVVADQEPVDIDDIVETCWDNVSTDDAAIEVPDRVTIPGDYGRLQHLFENLFRNAVEHAGPDVTVRVGQIDDHGIYVEDDGPGIPESARASVFEPGNTSTQDGTGFGLTIVRRIAEAHDWQVEVVPGTDGGARFEVTNIPIGDG